MACCWTCRVASLAFQRTMEVKISHQEQRLKPTAGPLCRSFCCRNRRSLARRHLRLRYTTARPKSFAGFEILNTFSLSQSDRPVFSSFYASVVRVSHTAAGLDFNPQSWLPVKLQLSRQTPMSTEEVRKPPLSSEFHL